MSQSDSFILRNDLRPGDLGWIVHLHGVIHAQECGFDATMEAYVAVPLSEFLLRRHPRERIWIAEKDGHIVGCIAIVEASQEQAQLRWFLVDPSARGLGLGKRLLMGAIEFCREQDYRTIMLWTVSALKTAAHLYRTHGFTKVEEKPGLAWGVEVVEERYERDTTSDEFAQSRARSAAQ